MPLLWWFMCLCVFSHILDLFFFWLLWERLRAGYQDFGNIGKSVFGNGFYFLYIGLDIIFWELEYLHGYPFFITFFFFALIISPHVKCVIIMSPKMTSRCCQHRERPVGFPRNCAHRRRRRRGARAPVDNDAAAKKLRKEARRRNEQRGTHVESLFFRFWRQPGMVGMILAAGWAAWAWAAGGDATRGILISPLQTRN